MTTWQLAVINEQDCIGCTKCVQVCPFDAIIGALNQMHTIIKTDCTGCGLCIAPCPTDCIAMVSVENPLFTSARIKQKKREKRARKIHFAPPPATSDQAKAALPVILARTKLKKPD